jgi:hypothetical protein
MGLYPIEQNKLEQIRFEGYLYKLNENNKLKKIFFKLIHQDLYCMGY